MVGVMRGQVNESRGVGIDSKGLLLINLDIAQNPSLGWPGSKSVIACGC
jgi:hypothetical protein